MNRQSNEQSIREQIVKDFLNKNQILLNSDQLNIQVRDYAESLLVDPKEKGSSIVIGKLDYALPSINSQSSAEITNNQIDTIIRDYDVLQNTIINFKESIEDYFRTYNLVQEKQQFAIKALELEINKELLLSSKSDKFLYGFTEYFDTLEKFDVEKSNASIFDGVCSLGVKSYESREFQNVSLDYYASCRTGNIIDQKNVYSASNILKEDGSFFEHVVFTNAQDSIVDLVFSIKSNSTTGMTIGDLKVVSSFAEGGSSTNVKIYITKDRVNWSEPFISNILLSNGMNLFAINESDVLEVKVVFSKTGYDLRRNNNIYGYVFNIDFIGMTTYTYQLNTDSVAYLGPYEVVDENNLPYNFTMATIKHGTCCIIPEKSSVHFYLSKNGVDYIPCYFNDDGPEYVQFAQSNLNLHEILMDGAYLLDNSNAALENQYGITLSNDECLSNIYIPASNLNLINRKSITLKRDTRNQTSVMEVIYGNKIKGGGWYYDSLTGYYKTTIEIKQPEGRYIDFGPTTILLNGKQMSKLVFLPQGIHKFATNQEPANIFGNLKNVTSLKRFDKHYPYNHVLLIQGYPYPEDFNGERIYNGVSNNFSFETQKVSNVRFDVVNQNYLNYLSFYTEIENEHGLFFKFKKSRNSVSYLKEKLEIEYKTLSDSSDIINNKMYIKIVFKTNNKYVSPKVDSIQVRVI
jgi:hypothetical protein